MEEFGFLDSSGYTILLDDDREKFVSFLMEKNPTIKISKISFILGCSERTVKYLISSMKKRGKISREGGKRFGKWVVNGRYGGDKIVKNTFNYVEDLLSNEPTGHDFNHALRVLKTAISIKNNYPKADIMYVFLASLLHDADDSKLFNTKNNANARRFLKSQNVPKVDIENIIQIINEISFSKNKDKKPSSIEAMIVQDADRLDAIGAIGIARTFAYGGKNGRPLEASIQHFYDKLLLIKDKLNTKEAKEIAEDRHQMLLDFLEEYKEETL